VYCSHGRWGAFCKDQEQLQAIISNKSTFTVLHSVSEYHLCKTWASTKSSSSRSLALSSP
jgi:hypothetical protein